MHHSSALNTRRKLLIPALLAVLLIVLVYPSKQSAPTIEHEPSRLAERCVERFVRLDDSKLSRTERPRLSLEDALKINPFEMPKVKNELHAVRSMPETAVTSVLVEATPTPDDEEVHDSPVATQTITLQAVFFDQRGAAAIIEDRILRLGDRLPDGRTIVHITRHGVELGP